MACVRIPSMQILNQQKILFLCHLVKIFQKQGNFLCLPLSLNILLLCNNELDLSPHHALVVEVECRFV